MSLLTDPRAWVSFLTLALLEVVLGIDNIVFLTILVDRLPQRQRRSGRLLGLGFAMLTRIALLLSVTWVATLRAPLVDLGGFAVTGRDLILLGGGLLVIVQGVVEIRELQEGQLETRQPRPLRGFWLLIAQVGLLDIVFSLDTVFTAVGLANQVEVMVAAIVASVLVMMVVASRVGAFIERYPTIKMLALATLVIVGIALVAEALHREIPKGYLYFAMAFAGAVEWLNLRLRGRREAGS